MGTCWGFVVGAKRNQKELCALFEPHHKLVAVGGITQSKVPQQGWSRLVSAS